MSRVLIVDDEDEIRSNLTRFFANKGFSVTTAANGNAAIGLVEAFSPDLVLLDLRLPDMDGLEILPIIKRIDPFIGVIIVTGYGSVDVAVQALQAHADHFLLKPVELRTLETVAARVLKTNRHQEQLAFLRDRQQEKYGGRDLEKVVLPEAVVENVRHIA